MITHNSHWYFQPRLILGIIVIFALTGLFSWHYANEQEDPSFAYRNGMILLSNPGMNIEQLTDQGVRPIERILSEIDEIHSFSARIKQGYANIDIELKDSIYETDVIWQRIKDRTAQAAVQMGEINLSVHDRIQDTQGIVLSVNSNQGLLEDRRTALVVRDELLKLPDVRTVSLIGAPKEQLSVEYSPQSMRETGISPIDIATTLQQRNAQTSLGTLQNALFNTGVNSLTRLDTLQSVKDTQITMANGQSIPLSSIANINYRADLQSNEQFWYNGKRTVGLALTLPPDSIRVTEAGRAIRNKINELNQKYGQEVIKVHLFQPDWTKKRRSALLASLLYSCLGVALVLMCLMTIRSALIVSLSIPAIALSALGIFGMFGGVIHQMTIAGLVLSLGLMVDNSIVMAERIVYHLEKGLTRSHAAIKAIKELYKPLATATLTTIAAFVPMLLSKGGVADFIATIPILVIICIVLSYIISLSFVPTLSKLLASDKKSTNRITRLFNTAGGSIAHGALSYPKSTLAVSVCVVGLLISLPASKGEFFPKTNRDQAYVDIQLPLGSSIDETTKTANEIALKLNKNESITNTYSFTGNSGPRFYYNLVQQPNESHIARVVFETKADVAVADVVSRLNDEYKTQFPNFIVTAHELGQGPPIESPIEIRVLSNTNDNALGASEAVFALLNERIDTKNVRRAYALGKPTLHFKTDKQQLQISNITEQALSQYLAWQTTGLKATALNYTLDPIDLVVTVPQPVNNSTELLSTQILSDSRQYMPASLFIEQSIIGSPPVAVRENGFHALTILSDVVTGYSEEDIIQDLQSKIVSLKDKFGVTIEFGGEAAESEQANSALLVAMPAGIVLLFVALLLQFNSYRLSLVVMFSIPLGAIGAPAMLSLVNIPFGFMSILGVLALAGIVVNTAIILIESTIKGINNGLQKKQAIAAAVNERFRPILLTTITTIIGMLPLTSSQSPLWPPLAWAVIGGLITSTALMMFIMPVTLNLLLKTARHDVKT
jgi:multidrug efflux pump subunit AcrB